MDNENNLEYDLMNSSYIVDKCKNSEQYCQHLYAALCNNEFLKISVENLLRENPKWSCSWRYAGGIIADIKNEGDYMDWYCSGIVFEESYKKHNIVPEGELTEEIENDLKTIGWLVIKDEQT